jgi:hypothetical protein
LTVNRQSFARESGPDTSERILVLTRCLSRPAEVDNLSYAFGLGERAKERVDTYGHVRPAPPPT